MESAAIVVRLKWNNLEHKGVAFPPVYQPRGISIRVNGERLTLTPDLEERIYAWAKKKDTHYIHDEVFQSNFLSDLKKLLPERFQNIQSVKEIDFSDAFENVEKEKKMKEAEKERIRNLPIEERRKLSLAKKLERQRLTAVYGKAVLDGVEVDVANWLVEPPGLFMGRGLHPLRGKWKFRVYPQDVTLNMGENGPAPEGAWRNIVHDHSSTWLATWIEKLTGKRKYVWLHDSSILRQNNDKEKYDKANKLEKHITKIQREIIKRMLNSRDLQHKKLATVSYLIFKLAMRVGDEKDPEEADTVGASTLRVEHIKFPVNKEIKFIEFNFLGKDSVPWQKTLEVNSEDTRGLYNILKLLMNGKDDRSQIFDGITSNKVNAFLRGLDPNNVPGLTAKVFRTFITTRAVKEALANPAIKVDRNSSEPEKIYVAKMANLKAAITCNHKKGIDPKNPASKRALDNFNHSIQKKQEAIENVKAEIKAMKWKTETQKKKLEQKLERINMQLKLQNNTRDYNLGTSLRNYIDPRVMKAWLTYVDLDWKKIYTATLQRKFKWVEDYTPANIKTFYPKQDKIAEPAVSVVQEES
jgi:DNA topoisomerase-1